MFSPNVICIATGAAMAGILMASLSGCRIGGDDPAPSVPSIETTRIPAPRYTAPTGTLPIMPTWTYGPGGEAIEVSR